MVMASVEGAVDFKQIDILDPKDKRRLSWTLDYLEWKQRDSVVRTDLLHHVGALSYPDEGRYRYHWKEAGWLHNWLSWASMPWEPRGPFSSQEAATLLAQLYKERCGDVNDPAFQAEIDRLLNYWKECRNVATAAEQTGQHQGIQSRDFRVAKFNL